MAHARMPAVLGVIACAVMAFSFLTSEMLPVGLLPRIANSFDVSLPIAGLLLSAYAFVVTVAGPPLTASLGHVPRKRLLLVLAGALVFSTGLCALAQSYAFLMFARLLNALAHGVFWSIVTASATSLVPVEKRGSALAIVYAGSSIGIILGVPLATFAGERLGWHAAFWCVAGVAMLAFATLAFVPPLPPARPSALADVRRLLANASFVRLLLTTVLVVTGYFTVFTYFTPLLQSAAARVAGGIPTLLLLYGVAGFGSTFVFSSIAQRRSALAVVGASALIVLAFVTLAFCSSSRDPNLAVSIAAVIVWGFGTGGVVVSLQARVLAAQPDNPDVASSLNSSAFNLGIGGGAIVGGIVLRSVGLAPLPLFATLLVVAAIGLQVIPFLRDRYAKATA